MKRRPPLERRTPLAADQGRRLAFLDRGRRSSARSLKRTPTDAQQAMRDGARKRPKSRPISPASKAQRAKVRGELCIVCAADSYTTSIDPAHLIPRSLGGGDDPLDVVPLCRAHHDAYETNDLDLLPHLEPRYRDEVAQAVRTVGIARAYEEITGQRLTVEAA